MTLPGLGDVHLGVAESPLIPEADTPDQILDRRIKMHTAHNNLAPLTRLQVCLCSLLLGSVCCQVARKPTESSRFSLMTVVARKNAFGLKSCQVTAKSPYVRPG